MPIGGNSKEIGKEYLKQEFTLSESSGEKHNTYCSICNTEHQHIANPVQISLNQVNGGIRDLVNSSQYNNERILRLLEAITIHLEQINKNIAIMAKPVKDMDALGK